MGEGRLGLLVAVENFTPALMAVVGLWRPEDDLIRKGVRFRP
jgi:hypothetical protein